MLFSFFFLSFTADNSSKALQILNSSGMLGSRLMFHPVSFNGDGGNPMGGRIRIRKETQPSYNGRPKV